MRSMYRVSSSRTTPSGFFSQLLTAWKSKALTVTALSESVSRFTESTFFILPLCSTVPFYFLILWFWVFDLLFKRKVEICILTNFLLFCQSVPSELFCYWSSKTWHGFFHNFLVLLLLIITDFTWKIH